MLKLTTLTVTLFLHYTKCSLVIDSVIQKGVYVSNYCPKMKYCAEGSHVMCMYYNPTHIMGPRCNRPKNVSITRDLADKLLEVSNAVRSKIALGKEKGKKGEFLPKGYGMFKLKWDSELATFAQVLANQCVLRHDMCRATKRFSDPGQTAGLVRFTYPDWFPVSKAGHFTKPGLTTSKLSYAITQTLKSWYGQKTAVTPGMITSYPDWTENPNNQGGRLYLEMIYGAATHMGCGISAYTEYAYYDNNAALNYNSIQVICNYSSRPRKGGVVYQVEPPSEEGYTVRCGCPIGMDEDPDCLCYDSNRNSNTASPRTCSETGHCKPSVVLLPIFTAENAPPEKLNVRSGFDVAQYEKKESEVEIPDLYLPADNTSVLHPMLDVTPTNIQSVIGNIMNDANSQNFQSMSPMGNNLIMDNQYPDSNSYRKSVRLGYSNLPIKRPQSVMSNLVNNARHKVNYRVNTPRSTPLKHDVPKRVFGKRPTGYHPKQTVKTVRPSAKRVQRKKSVFSKVRTFALPKAGENVIKSDVAPRKDFTNVKNLAKDYLNFKKGQKKTFKPSIYDPEHHRDGLNFKTTTERFLNSAEDKVMNYNYYLKNVTQTINKPTKGLFDFDTTFSKDSSKDKLMTLLDKLEQEVKHIELDRNKKEIFDAKIRKIYGTVVGEPGLLDHKTDHEADFTDADLTDFDKYEALRSRHSDVEGKRLITKPHDRDDVEELEKNIENIHDKFSDLDNEIRPIARTQNTLYVGKLANILDQRNMKKARDGYASDMKHPYSDVDELRASIHKDIFSSGNDMKSDSDKEILRTRNIYSDPEDKKISKYPEKRKIRDEDDPLDSERRKFYQNKLENLERKLHNTRSFKHHKDNSNRQIRPVLPTVREEQPLRRSKNQPDPFYMPDRARFLHGF